MMKTQNAALEAGDQRVGAEEWRKRRALVHCVLCALLLAGATDRAPGAVFHFSVPVATAKGTNRAWLWIPPAATQVRGVVMAGMTLMEREFVEDGVIRRACADEQLALVFLNCGLAAPDLTRLLADFASVSGYEELTRAPLFFVGHSAGGPQAKERAIQFADRCFGVVQYRGGVPGGSNAVPPGIPALMMIGQFDEFGGTMRDDAGREAWEGGRDALAAFRAANERNLGSVVVEPGAGHFAWSERNAKYLALFLRKAAQARIPADWPSNLLWQVQQKVAGPLPTALREINPSSGWLAELPARGAGRHAAASHGKFAGSKTNAAWHFDREMAEATVAYHTGLSGRRDQFIRWSDPVWVDAGARFFLTKVQWVGDGQTFEVHPVYADKYPGLYVGKGPRWPDAGRPVGHSPGSILARPVGGPVVVAGTNRLRIQFDGLAPASEGGRVTFMAFSAGDAEFRYTEQVGMMPRGFNGFKTGKPQRITFAPLPNLKPDSRPLKLTAASDAGLPVEFYVAHGPAVVTNGTLHVAELPARAKFPIEVKVVAWQFGRGVEPLVQTAPPVAQTTKIEKP
jgi:hypothetical protein